MSKLPFTYDRGSVRDADGVLVAEVFGTDAEGTQMAAAPALLTAAKRALVVLKAQGESVRPGNALGALDAAIARAEGH